MRQVDDSAGFRPIRGIRGIGLGMVWKWSGLGRGIFYDPLGLRHFVWKKEDGMWILKNIEMHGAVGTVMDITEYGGDSTNSIEQLEKDLIYMIRNPEILAGNKLALEYAPR